MTATALTGAPSTQPTTTATAPKSTTDPLVDKSTFLQLLVAQLQHQDPLNPADGLQFVTQLAQFTNLEQTIEMRTDLGAIRDALTAPKTASNA